LLDINKALLLIGILSPAQLVIW